MTDYYFEMGPIRPPSEGRDSSLLLRVTCNCPWNRCEFCNSYRGQRFVYRGVAAVKTDIAAMKRIADGLKATALRLRYGAKVNDDVLAAFMLEHPELYGKKAPLTIRSGATQSLMNVANWLAAGGATVFLQDADSLIIRTPELVDILKDLTKTFPSINRITSYARSRTIARKSFEEMKALHEAGLSRLHIGLESGCDAVLAFVQKGVTATQHIDAGRKVMESGIELSEYVIPGLGGRHLAECHIVETARVLNAINPHFIRLRSLIVRRDTALRHKLETGEFEAPSEDEIVAEIRALIERLEVSSYLASDQMSNLLLEIEGQLPQDKARMLEMVKRYQGLSPVDRLRFRLRRRLRSYLNVYGGLSPELEAKTQAALEAADSGTPDAADKVNLAISALKDGFV